jgi:hypothetical protein
MNIVRKLSAKTVIGNVKALAPKDGSTAPLFQVYGVGRKIVEGESTYGPWACIAGDFRAVRSSDGEVFAGSKVFLPEVAHDMAANALHSTDAESIELAFEIGVRATDDERGGAGYEYTVKPLIEAAENDPTRSTGRESTGRVAGSESGTEKPR